MADTHTTSCADGKTLSGGLLPVSPYTALQFHFGMLLGVDDLETLEAYPRGKMRLHNAWLHREGVVWGFEVETVAARSELQVGPGLALDAAGRELHLETPACVSLGAWFDAHQAEFDPPVTPDTNGVVTFTGHVVARFKACLTRPVPAITEPCGDSKRDVAYSRAFETVDLFLRPGPSTPKPLPYHRLRLLFGLDAAAGADDAAIVTRRDAILASTPVSAQPAAFLEAFREYAALDTIDLGPEVGADGTISLFPEGEDTEVLLADVTGISLKQGASGWTLVTPDPVVVSKVRPSHVATATIQELLCGPAFGSGVPAPVAPPPPPALATDAGGPRFKTPVSMTGKVVTLEATSKLVEESLSADAFVVTTFDEDDGWANLDLKKVTLDPNGTTVKVELKEAPSEWVRVIARGTGPSPILGKVGTALVPLAGADGAGQPPGSAVDGNDFVTLWKR